MKKLFIPLFSLLLLTACHKTGPIIEAEPVEVLPLGEFGMSQDGSFMGEFFVKAYPEVEIINEAFCEEDCELYYAVYLNILESGNQEFQDFLDENTGDTYISPIKGKVMIGCLEDEGISYANHSDEFGMMEFNISKEDGNAIMALSAESPGNFRLKKLELNSGMGAPTCYSHFTEIELL